MYHLLAALSATANAGSLDLSVEVCDTSSHLQQFTWIAVPSNLPPHGAVNAKQLVAGQYVNDVM